MNSTYPIEIFQTEDGEIRLEVQLKEETVWLTQKQMGRLFKRERSVITKHVNNIFKEGELTRDSVSANFAHTAEDGKTYPTRYFNLDVIISVGYRVTNPSEACSSANGPLASSNNIWSKATPSIANGWPNSVRTWTSSWG
jgi:hypothetical protein